MDKVGERESVGKASLNEILTDSVWKAWDMETCMMSLLGDTLKGYMKGYTGVYGAKRQNGKWWVQRELCPVVLASNEIMLLDEEYTGHSTRSNEVSPFEP